MRAPWKKPTEGIHPVARRRARVMSTPDLYNWTDALMFGAGKNLSLWRRGYGLPALQEAEVAILQLLEVTRELKSREQK